MIKPQNLIVIGTKLYLVGNEHLREFGKRITVEAHPEASNELRYSVLSSRRSLEECNKSTDMKGFMSIDSMITKIIEKNLAQQ